MKLAIQSYERNGYQDSDGYMIYLDTETMEVKQEEFWTTRFYAPYTTKGYCTEISEWTDERIAFVREWLVQKIIDQIRLAEECSINQPGKSIFGNITLDKDVYVRLTKQHSNRIKTSHQRACYDCGGTGKWINPRKKSDVRMCFNCKGTGKKTIYKYIKGNGSRYWNPGTRFKVIRAIDYGRYNFSQLVVKGFTDTGEFIQAPVEKLKLDIMQKSDYEVRVEAEKLAERMDFVSAFNGTWCDSGGNYINRAMQQRKRAA